ncbi:MAG TPA: Mur ligase family protein, partial [Nitrospiria bacterium]|nr:Mur ligase family protein [Nitrospiria bacterium]
MELKDKKVVVVGLGRSGQASARLLAFLGAEVWVTDRRSSQELAQEITTLKGQPVRFSLGGHPASVFSGAALAVVSPGVSPASLIGCSAPIMGEVELAFRHLTASLVAITGTNGKSTTTALVGEMLKAWGKRVFVGGNLGIPLCEAALSTVSATGGGRDLFEWVVAEVSSFQMETIET